MKRNRFLLLLSAVILLTPPQVTASEVNLESRGRLEYDLTQNGYNEVVVAAQDLNTLLNKVKELQYTHNQQLYSALRANGVDIEDTEDRNPVAKKGGGDTWSGRESDLSFAQLVEGVKLLSTTIDVSSYNILSGKQVWANNQLVTGTMPNRGTVTKSLTPGQSYTIPDGFHSGSGKITANVTSGTAAASNVLSGKTFYAGSNTLQTGTMKNHSAITGSVGVDGTYSTTDSGYFESISITGPTLPEITASEDNVLAGYTYNDKSGNSHTGTFDFNSEMKAYYDLKSYSKFKEGELQVIDAYRTYKYKDADPGGFSTSDWKALGSASGTDSDAASNGDQMITKFNITVGNNAYDDDDDGELVYSDTPSVSCGYSSQDILDASVIVITLYSFNATNDSLRKSVSGEITPFRLAAGTKITPEIKIYKTPGTYKVQDVVSNCDYKESTEQIRFGTTISLVTQYNWNQFLNVHLSENGISFEYESYKEELKDVYYNCKSFKSYQAMWDFLDKSAGKVDGVEVDNSYFYTELNNLNPYRGKWCVYKEDSRNESYEGNKMFDVFNNSVFRLQTCRKVFGATVDFYK